MHEKRQRHQNRDPADAKERTDARRLTDWGKRIYARRKETVERSFADAEQLHGHRHARMRGWLRVSEQCLLAATQNIKKIALLRARFYRFLRHPSRAHWRYKHHVTFVGSLLFKNQVPCTMTIA
jgi:hypothetical protein